MSRIVVGVDGSHWSDAAAAWAYEEAQLRGATLELVHCWDYPYYGTVDLIGKDDELRSDAETGAHELLRTAADRVRDAHPGATVEVVASLARGTGAPALLRAAEGADMLVIGSRGHGTLVGALLGSVSHAVVSNATLPVVVVRPPDEQ